MDYYLSIKICGYNTKNDWYTTIYFNEEGNLIVQPGADNDGDICLIDASGDSTMLSTENMNGHTYL